MRQSLLALAAFCLLLGGCAGSVIGDAINPQGVADREDSYCRSIGLPHGSPGYARCRMNLQAQTNANHQRALQNFHDGMSDIARGVNNQPSITVYHR